MTNQLKDFLGPELCALYNDGEKLLGSTPDLVYSDYSFLVFPYAKMYEGFLKKLFLSLGAITQRQYESDHWRVGKALNPQLEKELRHDESVYDRIQNLCVNNNLPDILWKAWKNGRNRISHYFPGKNTPLSLNAAKDTISLLNNAMEEALKSCEINLNR